VTPPDNHIQGRVLVAGSASGVALLLDDPLSFWGGFDPLNGTIIDIHHPQYGESTTGSVMFIPESRGSAGTPGAIAEALRNGSGPAAIVLAKTDLKISVGVMVANRLYNLNVPVVAISASQMVKIKNKNILKISTDGLITLLSQGR
jgi:predicted aconitase with swiveling domain